MDEQVIGSDELSRTETFLWTRYIAVVGMTMVVLLGCYSGMLATLAIVGALPPPAIVNELCADEKLTWIRDHHHQPNLLVVGSSIAWRDVDSSQFVRRQAGIKPLNGGMCHAQVDQIGFVARFLLQHIGSLRTVVAVLGPQDFVDCSGGHTQLFNPAAASDYLFGGEWPYRFYLSQFSPIALIRNASKIQALRDGRDQFDSLQMTRYGDGPLRIQGNRGLLYGQFKRLDPACFSALHHLATSLEGKHGLLVAMAPVNPSWSARYDPDGHAHAALVAAIRSQLAGTTARFWDGTKPFDGRSSDFTDAIHINWPAARRYSELLAAALFASPS